MQRLKALLTGLKDMVMLYEKYICDGIKFNCPRAVIIYSKYNSNFFSSVRLFWYAFRCNALQTVFSMAFSLQFLVFELSLKYEAL